MWKYIALAAAFVALLGGCIRIGISIERGNCTGDKLVVSEQKVTNTGKANATRGEVNNAHAVGAIPERVRGFYIDE